MIIITILSLIGVILNVKKRKEGFIFWSISNAFWCGHNFNISEYYQSFLYLVYLGLAIWGLFEWSRSNKKTI